jgi:hypothetical protein
MSPLKPRIRSNASQTSSVRSVTPRKSNKNRRKGGYYAKYLKYKIKYLESEKQIEYLEKKINKYYSI